MDIQKDSQKTEGVIKFLDYQTIRSSPFGDNKVGDRLYRKAERIASAIVLLTNHVSDSDVLKISARSSILEVLSHVLSLRDELRSSNSHFGVDLKMSIRKVMSSIRLLGVGGNISYQNADIVVEALDDLLSFLNSSRRSPLSESIVISRDDLIDARDNHKFTEQRVQKTDPATVQSGAGSVSSITPQSRDLSQRSQAILGVLRSTNTEWGIREVASNLPEYSEKMIQRELAELVEAGKVKKTGLKRWSRYTYIV